MIVKVNAFKEPPRLNEIFQSLDIKFSFLTQQGEAEFTQIIPPCKCRDFLLDMLWSKHTGERATIYGMTYDYKELPYDSDYLKLSLKFPDGSSKQFFLEHVTTFLNPIEEKAGVFSLTRVLETEEKDTLVVIADPKWQSATWKLSLYTYYLKLCGFRHPNNVPENAPEHEYSTFLTKKVEDIMLSHVSDDLMWFYLSINMNHNYSGFVNTITNREGNNANHHHIFSKGVK